MDDLISRKAAIETVRKAQSIGQAHRMLVQLPPAQPSVSKTEIVASDCISRQAAISICDNAIDLWNGQLGAGALVAVRDAIMALPSEQPLEDARAMCGECDAWNKYKNYPQQEQFNPCTVCQEFDCTGCKFRRI